MLPACPFPAGAYPPGLLIMEHMHQLPLAITQTMPMGTTHPSFPVSSAPRWARGWAPSCPNLVQLLTAPQLERSQRLLGTWWALLRPVRRLQTREERWGQEENKVRTRGYKAKGGSREDRLAFAPGIRAREKKQPLTCCYLLVCAVVGVCAHLWSAEQFVCSPGRMAN